MATTISRALRSKYPGAMMSCGTEGPALLRFCHNPWNRARFSGSRIGVAGKQVTNEHFFCKSTWDFYCFRALAGRRRNVQTGSVPDTPTPQLKSCLSHSDLVSREGRGWGHCSQSEFSSVWQSAGRLKGVLAMTGTEGAGSQDAL